MAHAGNRPILRPADSDLRSNEFLPFVEHNLSEGIDGHGHRALFIRPGILREWWTQPGGRRIPRALDPKTFITPTLIIDSYLIIFSILVFIGQAHYIETFVSQGCEDSQLPLLDSTNKFGSDPLTLDVLSLFRNYQWKFCPVFFSKNMIKKRIDASQILPIMGSSDLRGPMDSLKTIIEAVTLYPDCCESGWAPTGTVVFKQFRTNQDNTLRHAWIRECNALTSIGSCDQTVQYLGSFEQNNRCFIILEYANGGSLLDLLRKNTRPHTAQEIRRFWVSLMSLLKGINRFHNLKFRAEEQQSGFAHRDINPENILVFQDGDDPFSGSFRVKLADFETSTATQIINATKSGPQDNNGNRTYSAPEASRPYDVQESDLIQLPFHCDIWSLGCVLGEALVWLAGGWAAVQAAEQERKNTIAASHEHLINGGYGSCFHDGVAVLPCVLASHRAALSGLSSTDSISRRVGGLIEHQMLQPSASRATRSMDIWNAFDKLLRGPVGSVPYTESCSSPGLFLSSPAPYSPTNGSHHLPHKENSVTLLSSTNKSRDRQSVPGADPSLSTLELGSPAAPSQAGHVSRQDRLENPITPPSIGRSANHDKRLTETKPLPPSGVSNRGSSSHPGPHQHQHQHLHDEAVSGLFDEKFISDVINCRQSSRPREEIQGYEEFKLGIQPRHFMILIDDSRSMRADEQVMNIAESLAWLLKPIDSLGVEVRLTSSPSNRYQSSSKSLRSKMFGLPQRTDSLFKPIREWFRGQKGAAQCNMELSLNRIFKEAGVVNPDHPTSVLVLTNGIWQGGTNKGDNVKGTIAHVVKKMESMNMLRTDFTIQFVSFGNDPIGLDRLQYIDDHPPTNSQGQTWDIVDHKRHTDNIWEILWGAASEVVDGHPDEHIKS